MKTVIIDGIEYVPKSEVKPNKAGFFDGITTWGEAIELLTKANKNEGYSGHFVNIKGSLYFRCQMQCDNMGEHMFSDGRPLLTDKEFHPK